jgi:hypothetical protein
MLRFFVINFRNAITLNCAHGAAFRTRFHRRAPRPARLLNRDAGAASFVVSGRAEFCRRVLFEAGMKIGIVDDESVG